MIYSCIQQDLCIHQAISKEEVRMATGGSGESDVSEMFHRMGEKLGWFQHKDLDTALKAVSGEP